MAFSVRTVVSSAATRNQTLLLRDGPAVDLAPFESLMFPISKPNEPASSYPWENMAFEGGGTKGYAYVGALQVLEDEGVYPNQIRRAAGTSAGSLIAMFVAMGVPTSYMLDRLPKNLAHLVMDSSGGRIGSFLNVARNRGLHPGLRTYEFLGQILNEVAGAADINFEQMYERFGRELCVPVTNVTRMMTEYCHVKTTPKMPVRVAVRMSMSLPLLLQPVMLIKAGKEAAGTAPDVYVDGALLCNNPTHAFDGWWLSLENRDSFLLRLRPFSRAHESYARAVRFGDFNDKTLGFTVFAAEEVDLTSAWVRPGGGPPRRPATPTAAKFQAKERARISETDVMFPLDRFLDALAKVDQDGSGTVSAEEFGEIIEVGGLTATDLLEMFGDTDAGRVFSQLDIDGSGEIDFDEIITFLESMRVDVTTNLVGFPPRHPNSISEFAMNMMEAVSHDLTRANHSPADESRTIPIATDYVGTQSFDLEQEDFDFLLESARRSTRAFILDWQNKS